MHDEDVSAMRCHRITAEIEVVVVDVESLQEAASGKAQDNARAAERREVAGDTVAAIELLADPESVLDLDAVRIRSTTHWVEELERAGDGASRLSPEAIDQLPQVVVGC